MKKSILFHITFACLFLFSCKKDYTKDTNPAQKTYSVNFDVSGFTQTIVNSTTQKQINSLKTDNLDAPSNYARVLYYWVYSPNGPTLLHKLIQFNNNPNFGHIADNLPQGTYTVVIAAGKDALEAPATGTLGGLTYGNTWEDTFLKVFSINVTGDGSLNQTVDLDRIVGQLEVQIQDAIPANASTISIAVNHEYLTYNIANNNPVAVSSGVTFNQTISATAIGTTNYIIDNLICNTTSAFSVTITCYDAAKNVLGSTAVNNVTCKKNTRTILKGNLFGKGNEFNVTLNTGWQTRCLYLLALKTINKSGTPILSG